MFSSKDTHRFAQHVIDALPSVVYIFDIRQREPVFVSRGAAAALGYPNRDAQEAGFVHSVMHSDDWQHFMEHLARLGGLQDEEAADFEYRMRHSSGAWLWFHSRDKVFMRNEDGSVREVIGVATDVTERKNAEERTRFLADLNQALLPLADPEQIMSAVVRMLGEYLGVDRCGYAEVQPDEDTFVILGDYTRGETSSIRGRYRISDFGDRERQVLRENRPYVVNDIDAESPPGTDLSLYRRGEIRSMVCVPLNKGGSCVARMAVQQKRPRHWSNEEVELVTIVANRCWESVERGRALRSLKAGDERHRAFIANSSEAIWRFELEQPIPVTLPEDEQLEMLYQFAYLAECNDAMARMYGYDRADQILGVRIGSLLVRSDQNIAYLRAFRRAGYRLTDIETHEIDRHGNTKYFLNNLIGIEENGAIVRAWGTQRDITERTVAETTLRESEERYRLLTEQIEAERDRLRQILEQMPIGVAIAEAPSGRMAFHNLEAIRLLRHPLLLFEDYKGYAQYGGFRENGNAYRPEEYPVTRSLISGELVKGEEMRYRRGDGTETFFSVNSAPIFDPRGHMVLVVATFIDIAERKRAEEALRESEERFAKAFRTSPDSLVISRVADGLILEVNDSFVAVSGYNRDEIIGNTTLGLGLYADPSDRQRMITILNEQNCVRDLELALKRRSGEVRLMTFSAEPLDLRGEHCWLTIGRDITERKQVEAERERLLLQEKAAREEAEAANRLKDEFLATISHELRTPLTSILGWALMLADGSLSESQTRHALEVIVHNAKSQKHLIDDILDTSRIITGKLKLDAHPVAIQRVFETAVDVIRPGAEAKKITLRVVSDDRVGMVFADASRLQQAIWNLLSNAVRFTNEGGRIEARLARCGDHIEISISDTGIGIEPHFLPYIFDRFRQADSTSTRRYGGLGLGLAIVRYVVEMHGGSVSASSEGKGQGATFKVSFPLASPPGLPQPESQPPEPEVKTPTQCNQADDLRKLDGVRVLVVEDDLDTLEMLRVVLDDRGATVMTAASAREALEVLERWRPDVLVSDLAMPDQDGYELIGLVRSRGPERGGNIPAVALTAYTRSEDRLRALAAGFQMHVPKPIEPDELVAVLANLTGPIQS